MTIVGPDPKTLVDEVSADVLKTKMREEAVNFLPNLRAWTDVGRNAWSQRYTVTTLCRILQTYDTGRITSKAVNFLPNLRAWTDVGRNAWSQRYTVTTLCRILQTYDTGRITSKNAALLWGRDHLDPQWADLIQRAIDDRMSQWDAPADPGDVRRSLAFLEFAQARVRA